MNRTPNATRRITRRTFASMSGRGVSVKATNHTQPRRDTKRNNRSGSGKNATSIQLRSSLYVVSVPWVVVWRYNRPLTTYLSKKETL